MLGFYFDGRQSKGQLPRLKEGHLKLTDHVIGLGKETFTFIRQNSLSRINVSGKYKELFRPSKTYKTSLVYSRKDSNVVSIEDHVHL